jgi:hypothetical protein
MKEAPYFSHDADARNDLKIKSLIKKYTIEGYGIYWVILELMRVEDSYKLELKEYVINGIADSIYHDYDWTYEFIKYCVAIELFEVDENNSLYSRSFLERMAMKDAVREKKRLAGLRSGEVRKKTEQPMIISSAAVEQNENKDEAVVEHEESISQPVVQHINNTYSTQLNTCSTKKEIKEEKERKETKIKERIKEFELKVKSLNYPENILHDFFMYWSEMNKSGTKMRWELQETFDIERRVQYWMRRSETLDKADKRKLFY